VHDQSSIGCPLKVVTLLIHIDPQHLWYMPKEKNCIKRKDLIFYNKINIDLNFIERFKYLLNNCFIRNQINNFDSHINRDNNHYH